MAAHFAKRIRNSAVAELVGKIPESLILVVKLYPLREPILPKIPIDEKWSAYGMCHPTDALDKESIVC
ncbi:hypothetical protein COT76_00010 [Candidatus Berkelbacteria bacterium CG10_big_fil_rev_8_21_14_0_10_33_10]|nr:MAG: hypothetical protein COX10_02575 [Candidatus Berkelbacteria bacterium CG23_combo_of_CG06-09_8_20_14_all_33_15]PIS08649.1 MAG: hypothetical protein COT76_00010 [Candidatus Berkelbacteria bacterium CG10_big_fil_rev_8_21_14_0_10_33_10]